MWLWIERLVLPPKLVQSDGTVSVETATSDNTTISYPVMGDANKIRLLSVRLHCKGFVLSAFICNWSDRIGANIHEMFHAISISVSDYKHCDYSDRGSNTKHQLIGNRQHWHTTAAKYLRQEKIFLESCCELYSHSHNTCAAVIRRHS